MKITELKLNPNNPQKYSDEAIKKLTSSVKDFPKMMKLRPIIYDPKTMEVLGGNKRLIALQKLGHKEIPDEWTKPADELTDEEKHRFIVQDNIQAGEWDYEILAENWDSEELEEWGVEIVEPQDFSGKNVEIDTDEFDDEMIIKLKYTEDEYLKVREQLSKIAETPEQAVWKLLGNE